MCGPENPLRSYPPSPKKALPFLIILFVILSRPAIYLITFPSKGDLKRCILFARSLAL